MTPLEHSTNVAARMGRWSANHWKTAVFGWLAFVIASVFIGSAVGTKYLEPSDLAVGEAGRATKIIEAGFPEKADEQGEIVLIQSKSLTADDPAFKAAIEDVAKTLDTFPQVRKLHTPLDAGHSDLISADRHSAMVQFSPKGTYEEAIALHRDDRDRGRQGRSPSSGLRDRRARRRQHRQGCRRGLRSHARQGGDDRAASDARHPAVRLWLGGRGSDPAPARHHRGHGDHGPDRAAEPVHPRRRADRRGDPADRARSRDRLLALLPPPRARGACRRPERARRPRSRSGHVRPCRPDLRASP